MHGPSNPLAPGGPGHGACCGGGSPGGVWARVPAKAKWTGNAVFAVAWGTCRGIPGVCNPLEASVWDGEASVGRAGDDPRGAGGVARPVAGQGSGGLVETVGVWPSPASANGLGSDVEIGAWVVGQVDGGLKTTRGVGPCHRPSGGPHPGTGVVAQASGAGDGPPGETVGVWPYPSSVVGPPLEMIVWTLGRVGTGVEVHRRVRNGGGACHTSPPANHSWPVG